MSRSSLFLLSGPDKWDQASKNCEGRAQSPINVVTRKTLKDERLTPFKFENYQHAFRGSIINNGHSGDTTLLL